MLRELRAKCRDLKLRAAAAAGRREYAEAEALEAETHLEEIKTVHFSSQRTCMFCCENAFFRCENTSFRCENSFWLSNRTLCEHVPFPPREQQVLCVFVLSMRSPETLVGALVQTG